MRRLTIVFEVEDSSSNTPSWVGTTPNQVVEIELG